jgi:hypothetical protein
LQENASQLNFSIVRSTAGFGFVPMVKGKPLTLEELGQLSSENLKKLQGLHEKLEQKALETILKMREIGEEFFRKFKELDRYTILFSIKHLVDSLKE